MNKETATRRLHTHLHQHGVLQTSSVERCVFEDPFRFNVIQFVLSQGLTRQPIRKQCYKLLSLLVHVAGRTSNDVNTDTVTQETVYTAVKHVVAAQALDLTDPDHSKGLVPQLVAHLTHWEAEDPKDALHKRLSEVVELVTQALCCVNKTADWEEV